MDQPLKEAKDGTLIKVHVLPGRDRCELSGERGDFFKLKVTAPPIEGRANEECIRFWATVLAIKKDAIEIIHGARSRTKTLYIHGLSKEEVAARIYSYYNHAHR